MSHHTHSRVPSVSFRIVKWNGTRNWEAKRRLSPLRFVFCNTHTHKPMMHCNIWILTAMRIACFGGESKWSVTFSFGKKLNTSIHVKKTIKFLHRISIIIESKNQMKARSQAQTHDNYETIDYKNTYIYAMLWHRQRQQQRRRWYHVTETLILVVSFHFGKWSKWFSHAKQTLQLDVDMTMLRRHARNGSNMARWSIRFDWIDSIPNNLFGGVADAMHHCRNERRPKPNRERNLNK